MTVPANRVTEASDPGLWASLRDQWILEGHPGWVVRRAGGQSWKVVQTSDGELAFDPTDNKDYYDSTGL